MPARYRRPRTARGDPYHGTTPSPAQEPSHPMAEDPDLLIDDREDTDDDERVGAADDQAHAAAHGHGTKAVFAALGANVAIAVSKFVAFSVTGSSSMLAEGVHSVADSGNQLLLLLGGRRARRAADREHPFGYGRERYFWGFVVALVLFTLGAMFAVYEGLHKIEHPEEITNPEWAFGVLAFALLAESHLSFHSWPEKGFAAVDLFTCSANGEPQTACDLLANLFAAEHWEIKAITRGQ